MTAVVFAAGCVVPFHAEPGARCACDIADEPHRTEGSVVGHALSDAVRRGHYRNRQMCYG